MKQITLTLAVPCAKCKRMTRVAFRTQGDNRIYTHSWGQPPFATCKRCGHRTNVFIVGEDSSLSVWTDADKTAYTLGKMLVDLSSVQKDTPIYLYVNGQRMSLYPDTGMSEWSHGWGNVAYQYSVSDITAEKFRAMWQAALNTYNTVRGGLYPVHRGMGLLSGLWGDKETPHIVTGTELREDGVYLITRRVRDKDYQTLNL